MLGQHNCFLRALLNQGGDQKKDKKKAQMGAGAEQSLS